MNKEILNPEVQQYIHANLHTDLHYLLLKKSPFSHVSMVEIVQQIKGKKVAQKKFPFLLIEGIIFPPQLNLEQASSQATATFKSNRISGKTFLDLTAGFGIDAFFLSKNFSDITLVEQNADLKSIVEYNWKVLGKTATILKETSEQFIFETKQHFDFIYLDPARRDDQKIKKFLLEDLSPNLLEIQDKLLNLGTEIMIKLSPLIDISYLFSTLNNCYEIQIIAVKNEVKELVVLLNKEKQSHDPLISCINLESGQKDFNFKFLQEKECVVTYSEPLTYIYIPNNSILKSGGFRSLAVQYGLKKLEMNSHLYTSDSEIVDFPGRYFRVEIVPPKDLKKGELYHVISKNYPLSPDEIKKKYKIKEGGNQYLLFTKTRKQKIILRSI